MVPCRFSLKPIQRLWKYPEDYGFSLMIYGFSLMIGVPQVTIRDLNT